MKILRKPGLFFPVFILLLFSPNLVLLWRDPGIVPFVRGILVSGLLCAAVFAIFRKRLWIGCVIFAPFSLLAPAEAYYIWRYGRPSDANLIATVFESNVREASEYFGGTMMAFLVISACAAALVSVLAVHSIRASGLAWRHRSAQWVLAIALGVPAMTIGLTLLQSTQPQPGASTAEKLQYALWRLKLETYATYPFGVVERFNEYRISSLAMHQTIEALASYRFKAHAKSALQQRQVYVLILGEASTREHWSLFGYERPTNPELAATSRLVPIPDMIQSVDRIAQSGTGDRQSEASRGPERLFRRTLDQPGVFRSWFPDLLVLDAGGRELLRVSHFGGRVRCPGREIFQSSRVSRAIDAEMTFCSRRSPKP